MRYSHLLPEGIRLLYRNLRQYSEKLNRLNQERQLLGRHSRLYAEQLSEIMGCVDAVPRIAFVKQDVQDDLYCCNSKSNAREIVLSTLMRTGPVALFTALNADFYIVKTEEDIECTIWKQKIDELGWLELEQLLGLKDNVHGRSYGQTEFVVAAEEMDWSCYDCVISVDISVPARVTCKFPQVTWCYYVKEPKTSAYTDSYKTPFPGHDVFLNQRYRLVTEKIPEHVVEFPYYLQYYGCFHALLNVDKHVGKGVYLEHHTHELMNDEQFLLLHQFGDVATTAVPLAESEWAFRSGMDKSQKSTKQHLLDLLQSKYFVQFGGNRNLWGNAGIEGIAAGCLFLGNPDRHSNTVFFNEYTTVKSFEDVIKKIRIFENDEGLYREQVQRQRDLVDTLCFRRPLLDLFNKVKS